MFGVEFFSTIFINPHVYIQYFRELLLSSKAIEHIHNYHSACVINVWGHTEIFPVHLSQSTLYDYSKVHKSLQCHFSL